MSEKMKRSCNAVDEAAHRGRHFLPNPALCHLHFAGGLIWHSVVVPYKHGTSSWRCYVQVRPYKAASVRVETH